MIDIQQIKKDLLMVAEIVVWLAVLVLVTDIVGWTDIFPQYIKTGAYLLVVGIIFIALYDRWTI